MSHPHEGHERRMAGKPGRIFSQEFKEAAVLRIVVGGERVSVDLGRVEEEAPEIT